MELARRLDIKPLSEEQIAYLELAYEIGRDEFIGPFGPAQGEGEKILAVLRQFSVGHYNYLRSSYWEDAAPQQVANLVSGCKKIRLMKELNGTAKDFIISYSHSLLSLAILRFAKTI